MVLTKKDTMALSSCVVEFMAGTKTARRAILATDFLGEINATLCEKVIIRIYNQSVITLTKNQVFHGRSIHIHTRYYFIRECVDEGIIKVEHVPRNEHRVDILTKALGRIKFKEMRDLIGIQDFSKNELKIKEKNVGLSLKKTYGAS